MLFHLAKCAEKLGKIKRSKSEFSNRTYHLSHEQNAYSTLSVAEGVAQHVRYIRHTDIVMFVAWMLSCMGDVEKTRPCCGTLATKCTRTHVCACEMTRQSP